MRIRPLLTALSCRYAGGMPIARRPSKEIHPVPHLPELDRFVGRWVAVKDRRVIASAGSSSELAGTLLKLGGDGRGAVMQFVRPEADAFIVGVG